MTLSRSFSPSLTHSNDVKIACELCLYLLVLVSFLGLGSSSTSTVSLGSPTVTPSKLTEELGLGITYSNGYGHGAFFLPFLPEFSFFIIFWCRSTAVRE